MLSSDNVLDDAVSSELMKLFTIFLISWLSQAGDEGEGRRGWIWWRGENVVSHATSEFSVAKVGILRVTSLSTSEEKIGPIWCKDLDSKVYWLNILLLTFPRWTPGGRGFFSLLHASSSPRSRSGHQDTKRMKGEMLTHPDFQSSRNYKQYQVEYFHHHYS